MKKAIHEILREIVAGLVLDETPELPEHRKRKIKEPTKSLSIKKNKPEDDEESRVDIPRSVRPDEFSKDVRKAKRPLIKPPRREETYKKKWTGEGSREVRKEYQKDYRQEHGNGYFKKVKTASDYPLIEDRYVIMDHDAFKCK